MLSACITKWYDIRWKMMLWEIDHTWTFLCTVYTLSTKAAYYDRHCIHYDLNLKSWTMNLRVVEEIHGAGVIEQTIYLISSSPQMYLHPQYLTIMQSWGRWGNWQSRGDGADDPPDLPQLEDVPPPRLNPYMVVVTNCQWNWHDAWCMILKHPATRLRCRDKLSVIW